MALRIPKLNDWIYIYYVDPTGYYVIYDRTMPRDSILFVEKRIKELRERNKEAFYTIGRPLPRALI